VDPKELRYESVDWLYISAQWLVSCDRGNETFDSLTLEISCPCREMFCTEAGNRRR